MKKTTIFSGKTVCHVHIGAGDEHKLGPLGYVIRETGGKPWFYRIDVGAMMSNNAAFAGEFIRLTENANSIGGLRKLLIEAFDPADTATWSHRASVSPRVWKTYSEKVQARALGNQLLVQCLPFSGGRVYIPGSSVKGAIRTAVLDGMAEAKGYAVTLEKAKSAARNPHELAQTVEQELLGYRKINEDPFKALRIEDTFLPPDSTEIVEVMNVPKASRKAISLDMFIEAVKPGTVFEVHLATEDRIGMEGVDISRLGLTVAGIIDTASAYYTHAIAAEADDHYPADSPADRKIQDALAEVLDEESRPIPGKMLLRIGRFSHLESITYNDRGKGGLCQPKVKTGRNGKTRTFGATRNLVDGRLPLGVVSLKLLSEKVVDE